MDTVGWQVLSWGAACLIGVTVFLKAVADEIERMDGRLRRLEQSQAYAWERRQSKAAEAAAA